MFERFTRILLSVRYFKKVNSSKVKLKVGQQIEDKN